MKKWLGRIVSDERGATAVEYGLIISLVVLAMLAALTNVANSTTGMWNNVSDNVSESS
ncbi:Flp family type IVb pilin [Parasphingopyxis sp.]|uniref:Flp family type IVb pilin n=1 Tax=Parasphingopyxis sp. TaxID=1920299 RepID=UPI0026238B54|nr:Flp family type IVb pilin [Parasphingopyxis sp.]